MSLLVNLGGGEETQELIEAVLFDLGHTLVHGPSEAEVISRAMVDAGRLPDVETGIRRIREFVPDFSSRVDLIPDEDGLEVFFHELSNHLDFDVLPLMKDYPKVWEPYPEAKQVLAEVRSRGYRVGLVSNWGPAAEAILDRHGFRPFFEATVISYACGVLKPDPAIFRLAAERLDVAPESCLMAGDHLQADVWGALGAGMRAFWVNRWGRQDPCMTPCGPTLEPLLELLPPLAGGQRRVG